MHALVVEDLTVEYGGVHGYKVRPLDGLGMTVADGELGVLLGPSGSGKTTLLSCLAGLLRPTSGRVLYGPTNVSQLSGTALTEYRRSTVGIVFQAFNLVRSLTARENVMAPLLLAGVRRREAGARADALLERVGLADRARHRPANMSGGQQQRVAIARALAYDPPVLIADEPTAHLDHIQVEGILELLRGLAAPGRMVVVSTHDDRVTRLADRVVELAPRGEEFLGNDPRTFELESGELLFRQGDRADLVFIVEHGEIGLLRERSDGTEEWVGTVNEGKYFGELGPMLSMPRSCTATALAPTRVTGYPLHVFSRSFPQLRSQIRGFMQPAPTAADEQPTL